MALQFSRDRILWKKEGNSVIGHFRVTSRLCFMARQGAKQLLWKWFFCSHANKTHFPKNVFFLGHDLKVRVLGTRKWPILYKSYCKYLWKTVKFCENNAKKRQLLTNNTIVMCCEKKMARTWSSMTRQLFDVNDVHQLLMRTVVVFYY